jgi:hypothetical protein
MFFTKNRGLYVREYGPTPPPPGADVIRGRGEGNVKRETEKEKIAKENGKGKIRENEK